EPEVRLHSHAVLTNEIHELLNGPPDLPVLLECPVEGDLGSQGGERGRSGLDPAGSRRMTLLLDVGHGTPRMKGSRRSDRCESSLLESITRARSEETSRRRSAR